MKTMKINSLEKILKPSYVLFNEKEHTYTNEETGELYTGCTTISGAWQKEFLGPWYAKEMAIELKKRIGEVGSIFQENPKPEPAFEKLVDECKGAARRKGDKAKVDGTAAHDAIENVIQAKIKGESKYTPKKLESEESKNAFSAFVAWAKDRKITWLACEEVIASHAHKVAGKLDAIAVIDGLTYLVDFKTSSQVSSDYLLQAAGYDVMLREMGLQVMGYMVVRIPKDGAEAETLTITNQTDMQFFRETFLKMREAHKFFVYMESKFKEAGKMKVDEVIKVAAPKVVAVSKKKIKVKKKK